MLATVRASSDASAKAIGCVLLGDLNLGLKDLPEDVLSVTLKKLHIAVRGGDHVPGSACWALPNRLVSHL